MVRGSPAHKKQHAKLGRDGKALTSFGVTTSSKEDLYIDGA